jgi:hypothetical protein
VDTAEAKILILAYATPGEVCLEGRPATLRAAAKALRSDPAPQVTSELSVERDLPACRLILRRTPSHLFKVSYVPGTLTVEGDDEALENQFLTALEGVADTAEDAAGTGIARHQHIEYLGEMDYWRDPQSTALVISEQR